MSNFKAFKGGKSKALKGLVRFNALLAGSADELLVQVEQEDGSKEWGFDVDAANRILEGASDEQTETTPEAEAPTPEAEAPAPEAEVEAPAAGPVEADPVDEVDHSAPVAAPNMFGGIAATLSSVAANTPAEPAPASRVVNRTAYTIEKDRPQQNGIKRPSAGGLCRKVWDEMDHINESIGAVPTTEHVREAAKANGWNLNNAMIEYYQWRKFNGITGRAKKVAAVVEAPAAE